MKITDWEEELDDEDPEAASYWAEEYIEHPVGLIPITPEWSIPPDKDVLKAERHAKKLRRQEREARLDQDR